MNGVEIRGITFEQYIDAIGAGEVVSRRQMAERMHVSYTTAQYHLDRAVAEGHLVRQHGYIGRQPGWVYARPETLPELGI